MLPRANVQTRGVRAAGNAGACMVRRAAGRMGACVAQRCGGQRSAASDVVGAPNAAASDAVRKCPRGTVFARCLRSHSGSE